MERVGIEDGVGEAAGDHTAAPAGRPARAARPAGGSLSKVLRWVGTSLIVVGVLGLLFVAFQLWGTGVFQSRHQAALRQQLEQVLRAHHETLPARPVAGSAGPAPPKPVPAMAAPAPGGPLGEIRIPAIGLDQVLVEGVGEAELSQAPGHYPGTPLPGEAGNAGIAGHRTTWGHPFYSLDQLAPGDPIVITTVQGTFTYDMTGSQVVLPSDVAVLDQTSSPELTLTTCTPRYSAAQRLVVTAKLVSVVPAGPAAAVVPASGGRPTSAEARQAAQNLASTSGDWVDALWWGLGCLAVAVVAVVVARRAGRPLHRRLVAATGALVFLFVLFFFFEAVSLLLPASF